MSASHPEELGSGPPSSPAPAGLTPAADTLATHGQAAPTPADAGDGAIPPTRLPSLPTPSFAESTGRVESWLPRRFGDYELLEEIAHGGMGVVYKARQQIGGGTRVVALKMMLAGGQAAPTIIERFLTEARAAATLEHPHIVPIYDIGAVDGQHYFTMQLMPGGSLQQRLAAGPLPPLEAARLVQRVAEAVQHAHDHGIIHRDIKPHNILLTGEGSESASGGRKPPVATSPTEGSRPSLAGATAKLADFGLVRTRESGLSVTGEALGTPSYMPPEQARGELLRIGPPSDVYGLGAVLYALLTGRPPFQSADLFQTMRQVCEQEPLPPRQLNPGVPLDLETVCLKCLEKEPARRYASAAELAEELGRFERGEPVRARPVGRLERTWRWCKRNPAVAGLLAAVALTLALGAGVASVFGVQAQHEARRAAAKEKDATREAARANENEAKAIRKAADEKKAREDANASALKAKEAEQRAIRKAADEARERNRAEGLLYASQNELALSQWHDGNLAVARDILESTKPERRGWEHRYLNTLFNHLGQRTFLGHTSGVGSVAYSPDGKRIVSGSGDKTVKVWEAHTGQEALSLKGHTGYVWSVAFSPDGKRIVSGSMDNTVKVWDAHTGQETLTLKGHTGGVTSLAFSPDGNRIVSGGNDKTVKVWDAQTDQQARVEPDFAWHAAEAHASEAAGQWFAAAFHLGRLLPSRPWDAELHARRVYALLRSGQPTMAAVYHVQALLLNPSARFWPLAPEADNRGNQAASAGDWLRAAEEFRLAVHQPGASLAVWNDLLLAQQTARQQAAYRQTLAELLAAHEQSTDAKTVDAAAWCAHIAPCDRAIAQRAVHIAERLVGLKRDWLNLETLGVTLYRARRFAEAVKALQESIKLQGKGGGIYSWLFLAMAHKQLEHLDQARKWLDWFEQWYGKQQFKEWRRKAEWRLLHQEAKAVVNTKPHVAPGD